MTTPNEPFPDADAADPVDERLSAALDGAADAGGADSPATAERSRVLAAARDLLASSPPALDDVTRRRLLDRALAEGATRPRRADRWSVPAAAAALVVVVALGGWALLAGGHRSKDSSSGSKAATGTTVAAPVPSNANLGEVSKPERLHRAVNRALTNSASVPAGADSVGGNAAVAGSRCAGSIRVPAGVTPEIIGRATFRGVAAVVVVGDERSRVLVYVLASSDCRLLSAQFFTR